MTVHRLKTWAPYFAAVIDGTKTFEIRKADRDYQPGDRLLLAEFTLPPGLRPTGREAATVITYVLPGGQFGLEPGYAALGLGRDIVQRTAHSHVTRDIRPAGSCPACDRYLNYLNSEALS